MYGEIRTGQARISRYFDSTPLVRREQPVDLSAYNKAIGGPLNGPRHLLDSNVAWGQDLRFFANKCGGSSPIRWGWDIPVIVGGSPKL